MSKLLGSSLFFSAEVDEAIQTLKDADLSLQDSVEKWGDLEEGSVQGIMNTAKLRNEAASKLVENLILKSFIVDIAFLVIIIAVVAVLLAKRKRKQLPYATYQTTIEPPHPPFESKKH